MGDKLRKPDPEEFEKELRDLFKYADIKTTSEESGIRYGSLSKQLNPNDPTPSIAYEFLMFLFGSHKTRPDLEEEVWSLVSRYRRQMFPAEGGEAANVREAAQAFGDFVAAATEGPPEQLEAAKQKVLDSVERVTVFKPSSHMNNLS